MNADIVTSILDEVAPNQICADLSGLVDCTTFLVPTVISTLLACICTSYHILLFVVRSSPQKRLVLRRTSLLVGTGIILSQCQSRYAALSTRIFLSYWRLTSALRSRILLALLPPSASKTAMDPGCGGPLASLPDHRCHYR